MEFGALRKQNLSFDLGSSLCPVCVVAGTGKTSVRSCLREASVKRRGRGIGRCEEIICTSVCSWFLLWHFCIKRVNELPWLKPFRVGLQSLADVLPRKIINISSHTELTTKNHVFY